MSKEPLIVVENVSKKYCRTLKKSMTYGFSDIMGDLFGKKQDSHVLRDDEFWALENVSFSLKRGQCLGLIGRNGSGKSTLLKIINGVYKPDQGVIKTKGKVAALIEVGAGFHPMLTGRENIFLNGSILGMTKMEISKKLDAIIAFSELEDFIDSPVKNYSSGMYVRLGFSIAMHLEPDILLLDEVLAVGDTAFRRKCYQEIDNLRKKCALIYVSHSTAELGRVCDLGLVLDKGGQGFSGPIPDAIDFYYKRLARDSKYERKDVGSGIVTIEEIFLNTQNGAVATLSHGESLSIQLKINSMNVLEDLVINVAFLSNDETLVFQYTNQGEGLLDLETGENTFTAHVGDFPLVPGRYSVSVMIMSSDLLLVHHWVRRIQTVVVLGHITSNAPVRLPARWIAQ